MGEFLRHVTGTRGAHLPLWSKAVAALWVVGFVARRLREGRYVVSSRRRSKPVPRD